MYNASTVLEAMCRGVKKNLKKTLYFCTGKPHLDFLALEQKHEVASPKT